MSKDTHRWTLIGPDGERIDPEQSIQRLTFNDATHAEMRITRHTETKLPVDTDRITDCEAVVSYEDDDGDWSVLSGHIIDRSTAYASVDYEIFVSPAEPSLPGIA